ncbi:hypothetical protein GCM10023088_48200 [Actinomadura verrucosospora]
MSLSRYQANTATAIATSGTTPNSPARRNPGIPLRAPLPVGRNTLRRTTQSPLPIGAGTRRQQSAGRDDLAEYPTGRT